MPEELLVEKVSGLLDTARENVRDSVSDLVFNGELEEDRIDDVPVIYLYGYFQAEQKVAYNLSRIRSAQAAPLTASPDNLISDAESLMMADGYNISLSGDQMDAVYAALENNVSIITGGPGTGKTTILNILVRIFKRLDMSVALAAPTGRAAKRMEEATGETAMTIHRLLEYVYSEDEEMLNFGRNDENPLEQDVVIVDEASMIDIMLMDGLLEAVKDRHTPYFHRRCRSAAVGRRRQCPERYDRKRKYPHDKAARDLPAGRRQPHRHKLTPYQQR